MIGQWCVRSVVVAVGLLLCGAPRPVVAGEVPARYARHVKKLERILPSHFTIVVEPPFVVIGDGGRAEVERRAKHTVRWAVRRLKKGFFDQEPSRILDIYLFKGRSSYQKYAKQFFGDEPETPYGYYSSRDGALVMNISTGGGTLVHELVHPFVEADFPDCPPWLNEGLGSLFEASADKNGEIIGVLNWRLPGLQTAIGNRQLPSFRALLAYDENAFYSDATGDNYAQSRYLLFYLQERGLLRRYYREFHRGQRRDPTGYRTLVRVLGSPDMQKFQADWERWILTLRWR